MLSNFVEKHVVSTKFTIRKKRVKVKNLFRTEEKPIHVS